MLKKNITYTDLDGNTVTEEFSFHLSKAELVEMEAEHPGGLAAYLTRIVETQDGAQIVRAFKDLILRAYGKRSEDGKRFIKNKELNDEFMETEAYSAFFMELATSADAAAEFVNGIMPADMDKELKRLNVETTASPTEQTRQVAESTPVILNPVENSPEKGSKQMTRAMATSMSHEELIQRMKDGWVIIQ